MQKTHMPFCWALCLSSMLFLNPTNAVTPPSHEWTILYGSSFDEDSRGVSADGLGNIYITGFTEGDLGSAKAGRNDAFLTKFDANGFLLWTRQLGTYTEDYSCGVSADGLGNVYIAGYTLGNLGGANAGGADPYVSKYNASGTLIWTKQIGTSDHEEGFSVSADGLGNVFVSGSVYSVPEGSTIGDNNAFVSKLDASGTLLWTKQLGTSSYDVSYGVSADGLGNVYISGFTNGSLEGVSAGSFDAFLSKYDSGGALLWSEQIGTSSSDLSWGVSADILGHVYISGTTRGSLKGISAGGNDAFVSKYDANGTLLWTEQIGTSNEDFSSAVSADNLGNVYISGVTEGSLGGPNAGFSDAFVSKFDANGTLQWTEQFGTSNKYDPTTGVSADVLGNVYVSGYTQGSLGGINAGGFDVFLAKFNDRIPEPDTLILSFLATLGLTQRRWR